jgi:hypothetical protein
MFAKRAFPVILLSLLVLSSTSQIRGEETSISPGKRALIKELADVTQVADQFEEVVTAAVLQMGESYAEILSGAMTEAGILDDAERLKVKQELIDTHGSFSDRLLDLFFERVSVAEVLEQIYYPLYNKYFTEGELRDLIAFYETPTGRKTTKIMPQLWQESLQRSSEVLNPTIIELTVEILEEDKKGLREIEKRKGE